MTTNTTKDPGMDVGSDTGIAPPDASEPPPVAAAPHVTSELDLESRIKQQRVELINQLGTLRGDVRPASIESRDKLKARLSELAHILKWGVVDGWANLGNPLTHKLEQWLVDSTNQLGAKNTQT